MVGTLPTSHLVNRVVSAHRQLGWPIPPGYVNECKSSRDFYTILLSYGYTKSWNNILPTEPGYVFFACIYEYMYICLDLLFIMKDYFYYNQSYPMASFAMPLNKMEKSYCFLNSKCFFELSN